MKSEDTLRMRCKEIDRLKVIQAVLEKRLKQRHAAKQLNLSVRQVRRMCRRVKRDGARGLLHRLRGRRSNHCLPMGILEKALKLVATHYPDFGPTFANEKIRDVHNMTLSTPVLRGGMMRAGLWKPRRQKDRHRAWRERRACVGELVQLDGSEHDWFEGRGPRCALLIFIDDATSRILHGEFVPVEDTLSLLGAVKTYLERYGRPAAFYVDRDSIYKVNRQATVEEELRDAQPVTQFSRAMGELDIQMIFALSPQAKGRVERGFRTHQDRLVKELRLAEISTMKGANVFLQEDYIPSHNARYAVEPASSLDAHRRLLPSHRLDETLSFRLERVVANDFTVRLQNRFFQIVKDQTVRVRPKDTVVLETRLGGSTHIRFKGVYLRFRAIPGRPLGVRRPSRSRPLCKPGPGTLAYARCVRIAA